jgi:hypothetical protein
MAINRRCRLLMAQLSWHPEVSTDGGVKILTLRFSTPRTVEFFAAYDQPAKLAEMAARL